MLNKKKKIIKIREKETLFFRDCLPYLFILSAKLPAHRYGIAPVPHTDAVYFKRAAAAAVVAATEAENRLATNNHRHRNEFRA